MSVVLPSDVANDVRIGVRKTKFKSTIYKDDELPEKTVQDILAEKEDDDVEEISEETLSISELKHIQNELESSIEKSNDEMYKRRVRTTLHEVISLLEQLIDPDL